jgi:hypothetical protein
MDRQSEELISRLVGHMQKRNLHVCLPVPTKVVVELHADGLVKVYGPKHVTVAMMQRPVESEVDYDKGVIHKPKIEALVDEYIEVFLPNGFKSVYYPENLIGQQCVEVLTIKEMAERNAEREVNTLLLKALENR